MFFPKWNVYMFRDFLGSDHSIIISDYPHSAVCTLHIHISVISYSCSFIVILSMYFNERDYNLNVRIRRFDLWMKSEFKYTYEGREGWGLGLVLLAIINGKLPNWFFLNQYSFDVSALEKLCFQFNLFNYSIFYSAAEYIEYMEIRLFTLNLQ